MEKDNIDIKVYSKGVVIININIAKITIILLQITLELK